VNIKSSAIHSTSKIDCDALLLDNLSTSDTIPDIRVDNTESIVAHEATAGKINDEDIFYLGSRGMSDEEAKKMIEIKKDIIISLIRTLIRFVP